ncbi:hypothetical protein RclHR1_08770006 [Rhizophagus clarus]|uniref:Protein kinase domain-containing protein n=1 Tax=Rhizophagus clarus TaxID=94130 RepID=A0A2Z6SNY1_9GLOM|nr:hypothetical protein RclHR1_08770006 [Rhizophagus clarus]
MSDIREKLVNATINRSIFSINFDIYDNFHKQHEFQNQFILADKFLTNDEKTCAIKELDKTYDKNKIMHNEGTRRICENCNQECLATLYCENCVQNYLKANFSNWTSGNNDIDNLIRKCQIETLRPDSIIEWIPYNNLQNIEYLTKGGFSNIYTAVWNNGRYEEWNSKELQLKRFGGQKVVLKELDDVESANQRWFKEAKSHFQECLATLYCENCVQNYLKANFSNWTSGNNDIDNLIRKCQIETLRPDSIIEWIPYNNLQNIEYLTKGGFSNIYTAVWNNGRYEEWNSKELQLKRFGGQKVVLKELDDVESANQRWFKEAKSHLTISNKYPAIVQCYGLTQNPSDGNYMLVIDKADMDLRNYLQQKQLPWKEKIKIAYELSRALIAIHCENAIHRDLHSGNVLYSRLNQRWYISDLGFCGPVNKPPECIYGNLPYIAPEVISGKITTEMSDVYSISMLMWEISSGQPPFSNHENDYYLALKIISGMRPKVVSGTPLKYENLMKQCWDADPSKRLNIATLEAEIRILLQSYQDTSNVSIQLERSNKLEMNKINGLLTNYTDSKLFTSIIYQFKNLPEPRNATEEEQEAFHSKSYDCFNISNSYNFNNSSNKNYDTTSETSSILKDGSEGLSESLQINSNKDNQINYGKEIVEQQQIRRYNVKIDDDDDEIYDDKNFHSEEQNKLEIPDDEGETYDDKNFHSKEQDELEIPDGGF